MQLDLKKLFDAEEQVLPFSMELDLSGVEQWGDRPFKTPIAIKGEVQNRAGIVTVRYDADYILSASCARCLEPVEQKKHQEFFHTVVRKLNQQEDDDYVLVECAQGTFVRRKVQTETVDSDRVRILEGLEAGESVVVKGGIYLNE